MRLRLTLWFVFGVILVVVLGAVAIDAVLGAQLRRELDSHLTQQLTRYGQFVASAADRQALIEATRSYLWGSQANPLRRSGYVLSLQTTDGTVVSNSEDLRIEDLPASQDLLDSGRRFLEDAAVGGQAYRVAGTEITKDGVRLGAVEVAGSLSEIERTLGRLRWLLGLAGGVGCVVVGAGAWLLLGRALEPVRRITRTAAAISREDLSRRIDYVGPSDELGDLAVTMNGMLDRLEAAFRAQEEFISDVSHELRTPLTIAKGHLQVLDRQASIDPETLSQAHALVLEELDRMNRLVGDLLTLVRSSRVDFLRPEMIDLDLFLQSLVAQGRHLAERAWLIDRLPGISIRADQDRLTQVFLNLIQNAVAHTAAGAVIALGGEPSFERVSEDPAKPAKSRRHVRLWVRDEGEGMSEDALAHVFDRFYRGLSFETGAETRSQGLGLGLAIARAIVQAHGGRIEVEGRPGQGATFTVVLPT